MALVHEIIKDAFREANILPITQSPSLEEQTEALRLLNRFIKSVYGHEAGDQFESHSVGANNVVTTSLTTSEDFSTPYYVPMNARLVLNLESDLTVNLHPDPQDGSRLSVVDASDNLATNTLTLSGNGRKIEGSTSVTLSTDSLQKEWFYRADIGEWVAVSNLALNDTFPFPLEFEDYFVIGLATRLNPRNGATIDDQTLLNYRRLKSLFRARYSQTVEQSPEEALIRLTGKRLNRPHIGY